MNEEHKNNADLLYNVIYDFLTQNEMELNQVVGVLETVKLEMAISSVLNAKDGCEE